MATLDSLRDSDERALAARHVPADVLKRLSVAELRYRVRHAKSIIDRARQVSVPESRAALSEHARTILSSVPAVEYSHELSRRKDLACAAPSHLFGPYFEMVSEYKQANEYPPGLLAAVDMMLLGKPVYGDNELATVAEAAVNSYKPEKQ
jgi:hypothetical protein